MSKAITVGYYMDMNDRATRSVFFISYAASFLVQITLNTSAVFASSLFLSSYPSRWLSYYYIADPVLIIITFFVSTTIMPKALPKQSFTFILFCLGIVLVVFLLLNTKIYIIPFVLALLMSSYSRLYWNYVSNAISSAFDIRVYKQSAFNFQMIGTIGGLLTSLVSPILIHFFGSTILFYVFCISLFMCICLVLQLNPLVGPTTKRQEIVETAIHNQPFFRYLFILAVLFASFTILCNFSFQKALINQFSRDNLATFISLFDAGIILAGLILQALLGKRLLIWIGLFGLLLILPIIYVIMGISMAIWPTFILFLAFKGISDPIKYNFTTPCMQIVLGPYPSIILKKISMYLQGYAIALGGMLGGLIVFIANHYLNLHFFGVFVALVGAVAIYITVKVSRGYQEALLTSIKEHRFNPNLLNITRESALLMREDILKSINRDDPNSIRTGLAFFEQDIFVEAIHDTDIQTTIAHRLSYSLVDVRYKAAKALKKLKATQTIEVLFNQLLQENNPEAGWAIMDALVSLDFFPPSAQAVAYLNHAQPFIVAYGIIALDNSNQQDMQYKASNAIHRLVNGTSTDKRMLAITERYLRPTDSHEARLQALIQDTDSDVSIRGIQSLRNTRSMRFVPLLLQCLNEPRKVYYAEKALLEYRESILESLLQINQDTPKRKQQSMVRLLAQCNQVTALNKLVALSKGQSLIFRLSIAQNVLRYMRLPPTQPGMKQCILDMIEWVANEIRLLRTLEVPNDKGVQHEINVHLHINRTVFIAWFSLLTDRQQVAAIAYYIEQPDQHDNLSLARAYELLDSLSANATLRHCIELISENYPREQPIKEGFGINPSLVALVTHPFVQPQEKIPMNTMDKAAFLRQIKLFESLPLESIQTIAEIAQETDMAAGEIIFKNGDESERFYCIISGEVLIKKDRKTLSKLHETDYFGELGLLDNSPRIADALACTNGLLLYIEKEDFMRILEDLPEIIRAVVAQVVRYLRKNFTAY